MGRAPAMRIAGGAAVIGALVWLLASTRSGHGGDAEMPVPAASPPAAERPVAQPRPGPRAVAGEGPRAEGQRHGNRPGRDERWRQRMDRVNQRARTELGLDEQTARRLDAFQARLRQLKQQVRDEIGPAGLTRQQAAAKILGRIGGFQAEVRKTLGAEKAARYLQIVEDERSDPAG